MRIDLGRLPEDGATIEGEEPPSVFDLNDDFCRTDRPIRYRVFAQVVSGRLIVRGRVETRVAFRCSRCDEHFERDIREPDFERVYDLESDELPRVPDQPESVDLTPDIREATILNFPAYPVCRSSCKGLCPQCGKNLNEGVCDCQPPGDMRWETLDGLKLE